MEAHLFVPRPHEVIDEARRRERVVSRVAEPFAGRDALGDARGVLDAAVRARPLRDGRVVVVVVVRGRGGRRGCGGVARRRVAHSERAEIGRQAIVGVDARVGVGVDRGARGGAVAGEVRVRVPVVAVGVHDPAVVLELRHRARGEGVTRARRGDRSAGSFGRPADFVDARRAPGF